MLFPFYVSGLCFTFFLYCFFCRRIWIASRFVSGFDVLCSVYCDLSILTGSILQQLVSRAKVPSWWKWLLSLARISSERSDFEVPTYSRTRLLAINDSIQDVDFKVRGGEI